MATATRTITVNAAFLKEIKDDNRELNVLLSHTVSLASDPLDADGSAKPFAVALGELRDQFSLHFALEEAFGYFEGAVDVPPHLSDIADALREQHDTLFMNVCDLVDDAEDMLYESSPPQTLHNLVERFLDFYRRFQEHEDRENDLILETLDVDLGVGD